MTDLEKILQSKEQAENVDALKGDVEQLTKDEYTKNEVYVSDIGQGDHKKNVLPQNKDILKKSKYPPDECYEPAHPTSSHGWLMDDECIVKDKWVSEVKEKFQVPVKSSVGNGIRYQLQYKKAMREALQEMEDENRKRNELKIEPYESENDKIGKNIQFKPLLEDKEYFSKLSSKYPLYRTPAMTIYRHLYLTERSRTGLNTAGIPGMSRVSNPEMLWNKYCGFTTPIDQLLEEPPGGL